MPKSVSTRSAYKMLTCIYLCRTLLFFAPYADFYQKKTEKSDRLNVFIITFATLIKNKSRNKDYDEVLSTYSHIHVYHDP